MQSCGQSSGEASPSQVAAPLLPLSDTTSPEAAKEYFHRSLQMCWWSQWQVHPCASTLRTKHSLSLFTPHTWFPLLTRTLWRLSWTLWSLKASSHLLAMTYLLGVILWSSWRRLMVVYKSPQTCPGLNRQVSCPAHPSPMLFAATWRVSPQAQYLTTTDALCGYWQTSLAEKDQPLTTFITPYGRFRYLRGPMGFAATGDSFCRQGDLALQGVLQCVKVVDDILLYDEDYMAHLCRTNLILARCRAHGITLNAEKFVLAAPKVRFCGYQLSSDGIAADPEKGFGHSWAW